MKNDLGLDDDAFEPEFDEFGRPLVKIEKSQEQLDFENKTREIINNIKIMLLSVQQQHEIWQMTNEGVTGSFGNTLTFGHVDTETIKIDEDSAKENLRKNVHIISRPLKFGDSFYRIGTQFGDFHFYDVEDRPFIVPFARYTNSTFDELLMDLIKTTDDLTELNAFAFEMFEVEPSLI